MKKKTAIQQILFGESTPMPVRRTRIDTFTDYEGFTEKFKPRKTTDDCYTHAPIYDAVLRFINDEVQSLDGLRIVRPFWPGKSYKAVDYPANCVVIDNPPFSISAQIVDFYIANGIRFWLFTPHLTLFNFSNRRCTLVCCNADLTYENGAEVKTDFITNLYPADIWVQVSGKLHDALKAANKLARPVKKLRKWSFPPNVATSAELGNYIAAAGEDFTIRRGDGVRVRKLDLQDGTIFGTGILLSNERAEAKAEAKAEARKKAEAKAEARKEAEAKAEARKEAEATQVPLSERELKIIEGLSARAEEERA